MKESSIIHTSSRKHLSNLTNKSKDATKNHIDNILKQNIGDIIDKTVEEIAEIKRIIENPLLDEESKIANLENLFIKIFEIALFLN